MIEAIRNNKRMSILATALLLLLLVWGVAGAFSAGDRRGGAEPDDPQLRRINRLQRQSSDEAINQLARLSREPDARVAGGALIALGRTDHPDSLEPLYDALRRGSPDVKAYALSGLGQTRRAIDPAPIIDLMTSTDDEALRGRAMQTLGRKRMFEAMPHLIRALQSPDEDTRARANAAIRRILGYDFGFDPQARPARRAERVAWIQRNWRNYEPVVANFKKRLGEAP